MMCKIMGLSKFMWQILKINAMFGRLEGEESRGE